MAFIPAIHGLIRFSYPSDGGFAAKFTSEAEQAEFLYDQTRLERRFRLFEALTLPSLRAQSDAKFKVAILTGQNLPEWAIYRLEDAIADLPQAQIVQLKRQPHYPATRAAFDQIFLRDETTHIAGFRLDDDDAIHKDTVARIRKAALKMAGLTNVNKPFAISFNRGYFVQEMPSGLIVEEVSERTPLGIGLTLAAPRDHPVNVFRRNHRIIPQFFDTFSDASHAMFVRSIHGDNDSGAVQTGKAKAVPPNEAEIILTRDFGIDVEALRDGVLAR